MTDAPRALIVTGGIYHPFDETGPLVAEQIAAAGLTPQIVHGASEGLDRFAAEGADLLVLHCLAFTMTQADKYAPLRASHAYEAPPRVREAIAAHLAAGRGLLGLHTAAICFDTWPEWGALLGAGWVWGTSHHPPPGPMRVSLHAGHPVSQGIEDFDTDDELYCGLRVAPDAQVLATAEAGPVPEAQPVVTVREAAGRSVYSALGHDAAAFAPAAHRRLLQQAARWAARLD
jgi:type 1 glutamine amidotransferase